MIADGTWYIEEETVPAKLEFKHHCLKYQVFQHQTNEKKKKYINFINTMRLPFVQNFFYKY